MYEDWRLLIIEDDPDGREVIARILQHHQIIGDFAKTAEEAIQFLSRYDDSYTGVVIDLHLPGMDGWALLKAIQNDRDNAHLPCVAITAYHTPDLAIRAMASGFRAYIPKPLDVKQFVAELQRAFLSTN